MFSRLTNVTIYNRADEAVSRKCSGILIEKMTSNSFDTSLRLLAPALVHLQAGETYYAVGIKEDGSPVRTEMIKCTVPGHKPILEGSTPFFETPKDFKPNSSEGSEADMLIQYTNYSSSEFYRNYWGFNLQAGVGYPTNSPGPTLAPMAGQQSIGAAQRAAWFAEGPANIVLCWENNGASLFGVWIHFNFQMFRLGPRPIWYVTTNGADWQLAGSDPSQPYTWSSSLGYNVVATPTSGSSSLIVDVNINDFSE